MTKTYSQSLKQLSLFEALDKALGTTVAESVPLKECSYAINICDCMGKDLIFQMLIDPVTSNKRRVTAEKDKMDGQALVLECDNERAEAIIDVIRLRFKKHQLRMYVSRTGNSWIRI